MAGIITFTNQKGGVGKTSLAFNFGVRLRREGAGVLLVDMDPQCSLTYISGTDDPPLTTYDILTGRAGARQAIIRAEECDVIAASPSLSTLDSEMTGQGKEYLLRDALSEVSGMYDFIVIDSPPTLGYLTISVLSAAGSVVIPALADVLSLQGIGQLYSTISTVRKYRNPGLEITGIVLSRHTARLLLSRELRSMMESVAESIGTRVFEAAIRESVAVRESQARRGSIFRYAPRSRQAADYSRFTLEYLRYAGYAEPEKKKESESNV